MEFQFHGLASNTLAAVDRDTGTVNASFTYAPFGEVIEATDAGGAQSGVAAHRRRMNDKFIDEVSDLAYYGYRYYDKTAMQWTQGDPLIGLGPMQRGHHRAGPRCIRTMQTIPSGTWILMGDRSQRPLGTSPGTLRELVRRLRQ